MSRKLGNFHVFHRTWWKVNTDGNWPDNREPQIGKKYTVGFADTREEAWSLVTAWNNTHPRGALSDKAEMEAIKNYNPA